MNAAKWNETRRLFIEIQTLADHAQHSLLHDESQKARRILNHITQLATTIQPQLSRPTFEHSLPTLPIQRVTVEETTQ